MAQGGVLGVHTKVGYSATSSPLSYTKLNQVLNVVIPTLVHDKINTSRYGSIWKRNMPGMTDVSDCEITILQDLDETTSPDQDALFDYKTAGTTLYWRIEVPNQRGDPTTWTPFTFGAWINSFEPGAVIDDAQRLVVKLTFDDTAFTKGAAAASVLG